MSHLWSLMVQNVLEKPTWRLYLSQHIPLCQTGLCWATSHVFCPGPFPNWPQFCCSDLLAVHDCCSSSINTSALPGWLHGELNSPRSAANYSLRRSGAFRVRKHWSRNHLLKTSGPGPKNRVQLRNTIGVGFCFFVFVYLDFCFSDQCS